MPYGATGESAMLPFERYGLRPIASSSAAQPKDIAPKSDF
jgi:hypothetical protein